MTVYSTLKNHLSKIHACGMRFNFFCNIPYLLVSGARVFEKDEWEWVAPFNKPTLALFPPIRVHIGSCTPPPELNTIWSGFIGGQDVPNYDSSFFDYQFIYNPRHFQKLEGGKWMKFRKNSRKWLKRNGTPLSKALLEPEFDVPNLLAKWLDKRASTVFDPEYILDLIFGEIPECNVWVYLNWEGKAIGINIWSESEQWIHYMYCLADPDEPYLDEYLRLLFYQDSEILEKNKLVNDGGSLDSKGLNAFKQTLNPVKVYSINTYKIRNNENNQN